MGLSSMLALSMVALCTSFAPTHRHPTMLPTCSRGCRSAPPVAGLPLWDEEEGMTGMGMSVISERAARARLVVEEPDVEEVLSEWQEAMATVDDGSDTWSSPKGQAKMMVAWQKMLEAKEEELRQVKLEEAPPELLGRASLPAYLTGWQTLDAADDDERTYDPLALEALEEAESENADAADADFVRQWQLHSEQQRRLVAEERRRAAGGTAPQRTSMLDRWLISRRTEFSAGASSSAARTAAHPAVGIDLGTTNCAVAAVDGDGVPYLLPNADGARVFPSVCSFLAPAADDATASASASAAAPATPGGSPTREPLPRPLLAPNSSASVLVGEAARRQQITNPYSTYSSTKRLIGRTATAAELRQLHALDVPHSSTSLPDGSNRGSLPAHGIPPPLPAQRSRAAWSEAVRVLGLTLPHAA